MISLVVYEDKFIFLWNSRYIIEVDYIQAYLMLYVHPFRKLSIKII